MFDALIRDKSALLIQLHIYVVLSIGCRSHVRLTVALVRCCNGLVENTIERLYRSYFYFSCLAVFELVGVSKTPVCVSSYTGYKTIYKGAAAPGLPLKVRSKRTNHHRSVPIIRNRGNVGSHRHNP